MPIKIELPRFNLPKRVYRHVIAVITGFKGLIKPSRLTTQYPREKRWIPNNFRGLVLVDLTKCAGCGSCAYICPTNAIQMYRGPKNRIFPGIRYSNCVFCHFCVDTCPTGALKATSIHDVVFMRIDEMHFKPEDMHEEPEIIDESKYVVKFEFKDEKLVIEKLRR